MNDIITMEDMGLIFEVTDAFDIDRETLSVSLGKRDPGKVEMSGDGEIEIEVPLSTPIDEWMSVLKRRLRELGFEEEDEE